jgi:dolichol-phosphate mannosyltransferase
MSLQLKKSGKSITIVVPVYNEVKNIGIFISEIEKCLKSLMSYEILFVCDPSTDGTEAEIISFSKKSENIKAIFLSRRFGQALALRAGLDFADSDACILMDVDLQDPPEVIPRMIEEWSKGAKVVLAKRTSRTGEFPLRKYTASVFYRVISKFSKFPIPRNTGDFRLLDRVVILELRKFREQISFMRGLVAAVGFETKTVEFNRPGRFSGETKYNKYFGSLAVATSGIIGYSTFLLTLSTFLGMTISFLSLITAVLYAIAKLIGFPFPLGNPTIVILILMTLGIVLVSNGVLGIYVSKIFDEVKQRPLYIVERKVGFRD